MSIDTRLRAGLRVEVEREPDATVMDAWSAVLDRADRADRAARRRVRVASALVAVAAAVALVVVLLVRPGGERDQEPARPVPSTPTSSASATDPAPAPEPFEGTWEATGTTQDVIDHLREQGLGRYANAVLGPGVGASTVRYSLKLSGGQLTLTVAFDDEPADVWDVESYELEGKRLAFSPEGLGCRALLDWEVDDDRLTLLLADDNCPAANGAPDEAHMNGLYVTFPFTRSP